MWCIQYNAFMPIFWDLKDWDAHCEKMRAYYDTFPDDHEWLSEINIGDSLQANPAPPVTQSPAPRAPARPGSGLS